MATASLTRRQIIDEGLKLGGNPGLVARARVFLNLFLDKYWREHDWNDLEVENTALSTTVDSEAVDISSITDLRKISKVWQEDDEWPLKQTIWTRIYGPLNVMRDDGGNGRPEQFVHDRANNRLILYPIPDKVRSLRILYYQLPTQPDTDVTATYDADVPVFPDAQTLVEAVAFFAQRWNQDSLLAISKMAVEAAIDSHMAEDAELDQGSNQLAIELDPEFYDDWTPP